MRKYKIRPTKKQKDIIKEAWEQMQLDYSEFLSYVQVTEEWMSRKTGIDGLEFFMIDGDYVGVGNADRTMKLISMED